MSLAMRIRRKPGTEDLPLPQYMSEHAAGLDLYAANDEPIQIEPGQIRLVPTGLFVEIPPGFEGQVRARSGLALKHGVMLPNSPGTIDADYRGELQVILGNVGREPYTITRGMRFAQLVISPVAHVQVEVVEELNETKRAAGGFGHTGRH
ncbi:MAG: dUTP diphosphatase [Planctomycetes bacterium]|nr:dUTP diphosphatase [Planctomycetota bacterium]